MHRITPRIAVASAVLGVIVGIALGIVNLMVEYEERRASAHANTKRLLLASLPILESAYWEVDVDRVQAVLSGLLEDPLIHTVSIEDPLLTENQRNFAGLSDLRAEREYSEPIPNWVRWIGLERNLVEPTITELKSPRDGAVLGELVAQLSFAKVIHEFAGRVLFVLGLSILQALFVSAAIFGLVQLMVIRPITRLQQATVGLREETGFHLPQSAMSLFDQKRQDEISRLARAFLRTFKALEDSRRFLQKNVDERTAELRLARNEAIAALETKSQFLANMNHELRTPLNVISGLALVLDKHNLPAESRPLLQDIKSAAGQLTSNINSVLDLSKIEAGEMQIQPEWFSVSSLAEEITSQTSALLINKQPALVTKFEFDPNLEIYADSTRLRQIVMNFVSNACKFTDEGTVNLSVFCESVADTDIHLNFSVSDTGRGIPADKFEDVFRPFGQVDGSRSRTHEGTGLGMSIAQHLAEALGGKIVAESEVGKGSKFTFAFSVKHRISSSGAGPAESPERESPRLDGINILVVEDSRMNRSVFVGLLEQAGAHVRTAYDGFQAIESVSKAIPDTILMDLHMPLSDGYETLSAMQSRLSLALPPVVATSADATTVQKLNCIKAGFVEFISKPVDAENLIEVMSRSVEAGSLIDRTVGLRYAGGNTTLYRNSLIRFFDQLSGWRNEIANNDGNDLSDVLHVVKGSAETAGAKTLAQSARNCESNGIGRAEVLHNIDALIRYFETQKVPEEPELDPASVEYLRELIRERDPHASEYASRFRASSDLVVQLKNSLTNLRFSQAENLLDQLDQSL